MLFNYLCILFQDLNHPTLKIIHKLFTILLAMIPKRNISVHVVNLKKGRGYTAMPG